MTLDTSTLSKKTVVAMWSGPRNISTAMMRAFENRADTAVWDEPFYAHYLATTGLTHPMYQDVIEAGETDAEAVIARCLRTPEQPNRHGTMPTLWFQKHMTVHMQPAISLEWTAEIRNFFLIRRPEAVLASYHDRRANPSAADVGFERQVELFDTITRLRGISPPVVDSDAMLAAPEKIMPALCDALSIPFDPAMLSWPPGVRADDGVWAAHWYASVETSRGFAPSRAPRALPDHLSSLAHSCRPHYEALAEHAIRE